MTFGWQPKHWQEGRFGIGILLTRIYSKCMYQCVLCMCECSDDRQMKATGRFHGPLFHPSVRSASSCPARNKQCHWPLSSTDAPLRSQTHTQCRPTRSYHAVLAPYQRKTHSRLIRQWISEARGVIQTVKVSRGVGHWTHSHTELNDW